jgi:hypothetical protein
LNQGLNGFHFLEFRGKEGNQAGEVFFRVAVFLGRGRRGFRRSGPGFFFGLVLLRFYRFLTNEGGRLGKGQKLLFRVVFLDDESDFRNPFPALDFLEGEG